MMSRGEQYCIEKGLTQVCKAQKLAVLEKTMDVRPSAVIQNSSEDEVRLAFWPPDSSNCLQDCSKDKQVQCNITDALASVGHIYGPSNPNNVSNFSKFLNLFVKCVLVIGGFRPIRL